MDFFKFNFRPKNDEPSTRSLKQEAQIQTDLAKMVYEPDTATRRRVPPRKRLSMNRRRSMNEGDAAVQFKQISKQLDDCHKTMMQELRISNMSMKKKLDFALKKRGECAESRAELHFEEEDYQMNGGRRKRRRKTRRKKKRKSRRKSRKRKRKTKRRR